MLLAGASAGAHRRASLNDVGPEIDPPGWADSRLCRQGEQLADLDARRCARRRGQCRCLSALDDHRLAGDGQRLYRLTVPVASCSITT